MKKISFWNLISSNTIKKICIPTIQRDYALGHRKEVYKRNSFLNALKEAVCGNTELPLDFVYGVDKETMFIPLDGQQRLTTLWLLHWYIAYKSGMLYNPEIQDIFSKFSYETRLSSSDFCKSLCGLLPIPVEETEIDKNISIRTWIMQQTWFYHQYKQDPTIIGMLNMIAGTEITDKYDNDIVDGLEEMFSDNEYDFQNLWNRLTSSKCIVFHKLNVSLNDSDELYVKMNARGKQLTDFENFKTELVQFSKTSEILGETAALEFAAKLDVEWTDIFWDNRWSDSKTNDISIDEIYFAFIRRYVRLEAIKKYEKNEEKSSIINKISRTFTQFDPYKEVLDKSSVENFIRIMDNLRGHEIMCKSAWGEIFDFVPKYKSEKKSDITTLTYTQQLIFYGCCAYLIHGEFENQSFTEWNRVLWNICENRVDKSNFLPTISEIDILAPHSHDIISYLAQDSTIECNHNKEQLLEEQCKARKLAKYPDIEVMEGYAFFKGAIRFLFTGANGEEDWKYFEQKSTNVRELIPTEKESRHTIKLLTPYIPSQALSSIYFHWVSNNDEHLRTIILDSKVQPYLHNFLLQNDQREPISCLHQDIIDLCEEAFGGTGYLQTKWKDEGEYIWTNYERRQGSYQWASLIIGNEAYRRISSIIDNSEIFEIHKDQRERRLGKHIKALYLNFKYKDHSFKLYGNNTICLMTDAWENKWKNPSDTKGYYFSVQTIRTETELIENIENLLKSI